MGEPSPGVSGRPAGMRFPRRERFFVAKGLDLSNNRDAGASNTAYESVYRVLSVLDFSVSSVRLW